MGFNLGSTEFVLRDLCCDKLPFAFTLCTLNSKQALMPLYECNSVILKLDLQFSGRSVILPFHIGSLLLDLGGVSHHLPHLIPCHSHLYLAHVLGDGGGWHLADRYRSRRLRRWSCRGRRISCLWSRLVVILAALDHNYEGYQQENTRYPNRS